MTIDDYTPPPPTADYTPRPRAAQETARAKRERGDSEPSALAKVREVPRQWLVAALFGGFSLFVLALSWQLATPARPLALTPVPTEAPAPTAAQRHTTLFIAPTPTPLPVSTPPAAPIAPQNGAQRATGALQEAPPQTGRGLGEVVPAAPSYIENVGAQAKHSPRGGLCGPTGGDCAPAVPYGLDNSQYIANVGAQKPHKVR